MIMASPGSNPARPNLWMPSSTVTPISARKIGSPPEFCATSCPLASIMPTQKSCTSKTIGLYAVLLRTVPISLAHAISAPRTISNVAGSILGRKLFLLPSNLDHQFAGPSHLDMIIGQHHRRRGRFFDDGWAVELRAGRQIRAAVDGRIEETVPFAHVDFSLQLRRRGLMSVKANVCVGGKRSGLLNISMHRDPQTDKFQGFFRSGMTVKQPVQFMKARRNGLSVCPGKARAGERHRH